MNWAVGYKKKKKKKKNETFLFNSPQLCVCVCVCDLPELPRCAITHGHSPLGFLFQNLSITPVISLFLFLFLFSFLLSFLANSQTFFSVSFSFSKIKGKEFYIWKKKKKKKKIRRPPKTFSSRRMGLIEAAAASQERPSRLGSARALFFHLFFLFFPYLSPCRLCRRRRHRRRCRLFLFSPFSRSGPFSLLTNSVAENPQHFAL